LRDKSAALTTRRRKENAMSFEPALYDSPMYETADQAFSFCMEVLQRKGYLRARESLRGFEPINCAEQGHAALRALRSARPLVQGVALEYLDITINAVKRAVGEPSLARVA
jgi:hypothetical protein